MVILNKKFIILFLVFCANFCFAEVVQPTSMLVEKIEIRTTEAIKNRYKYYFEELIGHPNDPVMLKIKIDQITKEIFQAGYFTVLSKVEPKEKAGKINIVLTINVGERSSFYFRGNNIFSRQELQLKLLDRIKNDFGKTEIKTMSLFIEDEYENAGFFNTTAKAKYLIGKDRDGSKVKNYFFEIIEGKKIPIHKISLRGAHHLTYDEMLSLIRRTGTGLASNNFYDKSYFENFSDILKKEYLRRGYPFADVSLPHVTGLESPEGVEIEYSVTEKQLVHLSKISINQANEIQISKIKSLLSNQEGTPLNILELDKDLQTTVGFLKNEGYYFASIANLNSNNLLIYDKSLTSAALNIDIVTDRQVCFHDTIINGVVKTKAEVLYREVNLRPGEIITPDKLEEIKHKISGLGLFSNVKISPYMLFDGNITECAKTNLVVQVKEKDFGIIEFAPGYRTDLGKKLSTNIIYNNFMGMNRSLSLKTQLNQRDNLEGFDTMRKLENNKLLEYSVKASIVEPYIFYDIIKTQAEFELSSSWQRKRFYGFDANIFRFSPQLSKNFNKFLNSSIKYQFEKISQYDATLEKDNAFFSIGGLTVSSSIDMRDDPVNTRRGPYFNLSSEWANPTFGSMKTSDLEVNFIKVISRNKYYFPIQDFTLAFSLGAGFEKNFAQKGYIPSIKVFRLDGYDEIRGFDDGEINHLSNGQAIGDVTVNNTAFFTAFKFEPRYNVTDNVQVDIFFDAGRVYVNSYQPFNLRTSAGVGFKLITAVGAIDFSYGIKLKRATYSSGSIDSVGRFHLSIGYF